MMEAPVTFDPGMFEPGCKQLSRLFPVLQEFLMFQARAQSMGFERGEVLELVKALAEKELGASAHVE